MSDSDDDLLVVPDFLKKKTVYEVLTPRRRSRKPTTPLSPVLSPARFGAKAGKGKQRVSKFSLDSLFADNKHCEDVNKQDEEIVNMKKKFEQGGNYMDIVNEAEEKESINLSQNDSLDSLCGDSSQVTSIGMTQLNGIRSLLRNDFPDTFPGMELIVREEGEEVTTEYYRKLVAYHLDDEDVGEADEELVQVCRDLLRTGSLDSTTPQHVWVAVWKLMCFCQHADIRQLAYQFLMQSLSILPAFLSRATNFVKTLENFGVDLFKLQTDDESTSEVNRIIRTLSVCLSSEEASEVTFTVTKNIRKSFYSERLLFFVKLYTSLLHQSQLSPHELTCVAMVSLVLCCDKIIVSERHHFQVLAAQALDRFEDWNVVQMVSISKSITNIVSHHHNVLQICDFILPSKRGLELKQVFALLAASTIQKEGHEFFKYIILPLGPGEVMKLLSDYHLDEESDYYIANSFLLLLEQSLPTDHITTHQKRGLKNVVDKLRSLNAEVKEGGGRFLDRTKVKDVIIRFRMKLTFALHNLQTQCPLDSYFERNIDKTDIHYSQ